MSDPGTITTGLGSSVTLAGLATVALGSIFGEDAVILGMGLIGTLLALSEQREKTWKSSLMFMVRGLVFSYIFTGILTMLAVTYLPKELGLTPHTILGVVAFLIGWTSNKWARMRDWAWMLAFRSAAKKDNGDEGREGGKVSNGVNRGDDRG